MVQTREIRERLFLCPNFETHRQPIAPNSLFGGGARARGRSTATCRGVCGLCPHACPPGTVGSCQNKLGYTNAKKNKRIKKLDILAYR